MHMHGRAKKRRKTPTMSKSRNLQPRLVFARRARLSLDHPSHVPESLYQLMLEPCRRRSLAAPLALHSKLDQVWPSKISRQLQSSTVALQLTVDAVTIWPCRAEPAPSEPRTGGKTGR